jgi:hypothetical protein
VGQRWTRGQTKGRKKKKEKLKITNGEKMCDPSRIGRCVVVVESMMRSRYIFLNFVEI